MAQDGNVMGREAEQNRCISWVMGRGTHGNRLHLLHYFMACMNSSDS
jgi:hypothetical protein